MGASEAPACENENGLFHELSLRGDAGATKSPACGNANAPFHELGGACDEDMPWLN